MKVGNDCAFPAYLHEEMGVREGYFDAGMSKREYFAGQALLLFIGFRPMEELPPEEAVAAFACRYADALIAELERTNDL